MGSTTENQIRPNGADCVVTLWGTTWQPGASLNFKGKQSIAISEDRSPVVAQRFSVEVTELFDSPPNLRQLDVPCPIVWPGALRAFADAKFRPTVLDKDSFTATYAYEGGRVDGAAASKQMLKSYTNANVSLFGPSWDSFRIESSSLYLREDKLGTCNAEVKITFAGFVQPSRGSGGWYAVDSNFLLEKTILDKLVIHARQAASIDLEKGIAQTSTPSAKPVQNAAKPQLTILSEPSGAEIEINGEFIGNTPTSATLNEGRVTVRLKMSGFQLWERVLTLRPDDRRSLKAELSR